MKTKTITIGAMLACALSVSGCSSVSNMLDFGKDKAVAAGEGGDPILSAKDDDVECPTVTVRTGASTLTISGKGAGADPNALELRYQGTVTRTARECKVGGGNMAMKIGIEGRVIVGPAGGAGQVDVPLRLAVVHEGPSPRVVASKLIHINVAVPEGVPSVTFEYVEPEVAFPLPRPLSNIDSYVVYVGFDPSQSATAKPQPKAKGKPAAKPAPKRG